MGFKAFACQAYGIVSLLGALFYMTCAIMVLRRNQVFLEHKVGINTFTVTEAEIEKKFYRIGMAGVVSANPLIK